ncbi:BTB/POZ/MATH-domain protein [Rhynchospora pubera]|uniref:BTB/POZ/MATH-domain protein n=1 Tax=Rhynchospora pubera TaxID=906938 RepID=A0AAV8E6Z7_9POAL|nr:BTB/POZ/MATH-domain protein [Rhynchospora pubera]
MSSSLSKAFSVQSKRTTYHFTVDNSYSADLTIGDCIASPVFEEGGSNWQINYYPKGFSPDTKSNMVSFSLSPLATTQSVTVDYELGLLNKDGYPTSKFWVKSTQTFSNTNCSGKIWDMERAVMDANYMVDNQFTIVCSITMVNKPSTMVKRCSFGFPVNLTEQLHSMLESKAHADIIFEVEGQEISAHRLVLAFRSPVFEFDLLGAKVNRDCHLIKIYGTHPLILKGILHYVYTDCLPKMEDILSTGGSNTIMSLEKFYQLLMVSAEKYELIGLCNLCKDRLSGLVSIENAIEFLTLAEDGKYAQLKEICVEFITEGINYGKIVRTKEYAILYQTHPDLYFELGAMRKV